MSVFSHRPGGFKAGVILLFFSTLLFLVGIISPFWATSTDMNYSRHSSLTMTYVEGIVMSCIRVTRPGFMSTACGASGIYGFPGWYHAARALTCVCAVGLVVACIYTLTTNCCRTVAGPHSRFLEIFTAGAGVLGFVGCMVYVGLRNMDMSSGDAQTNPHTAMFFSKMVWTFGWGVYLASISSGLSLVAAILVGVCNKPVEMESNNAGGIVISTMPVGTTMPIGTTMPAGTMMPAGVTSYGPSQPFGVQPAGYAYEKV